MKRPALRVTSLVFAALSVALSFLLLPAPSARAAEYEVTIDPDYAEVVPGAHVRLTAALWRDGESKWTDHHWDWYADGGTFEYGRKTDAAENIWHAPNRPGTYTITVTTERARKDGNQGVAQIVVGRAGPPPPPACNHFIRLNPPRVRLAVGQETRFQIEACGCQRRGHFQFKASGGLMDDDCCYHAGNQPGVHYVEVIDTDYGLTARAVVDIFAPPTVSRVVISPPQAELSPGEEARFTAAAFDQWGRPMGCQFQWATNGGEIDAGGCYHANAPPGTYVVQATDPHSGAQAQAQVTIRANVRILNISPRIAIARPGQRVQFQVQGYDPWNRPIQATGVVFQCDSGQIAQNGSYTAGWNVGEHVRITVTDPSTGASDWADVFISQ